MKSREFVAYAAIGLTVVTAGCAEARHNSETVTALEEVLSPVARDMAARAIELSAGGNTVFTRLDVEDDPSVVEIVTFSEDSTDHITIEVGVDNFGQPVTEDVRKIFIYDVECDYQRTETEPECVTIDEIELYAPSEKFEGENAWGAHSKSYYYAKDNTSHGNVIDTNNDFVEDGDAVSTAREIAGDALYMFNKLVDAEL